MTYERPTMEKFIIPVEIKATKGDMNPPCEAHRPGGVCNNDDLFD